MKLSSVFVLLLLKSVDIVESSQGLIPIPGVIPDHLTEEFNANLTRNSIRSRIINGQFARENQFPYAAWINILDKIGIFNVCGGSLITPKFVLCAAHCVDFDELEGIDVYLGSIDRYAFPVKVTADAFVFNPAFSSTTFQHDLSLIRLKMSVLNPVATLPRRFYNNYPFDNENYNLQVAGWGLTEPGSTGYVSRYLMFANLTARPPSLCFAGATVICANGIGITGTAPGDSGGPLLYNGILVGIVSYSVVKEFPEEEGEEVDGFTRVDRYLDWIASYTGITISN